MKRTKYFLILLLTLGVVAIYGCGNNKTDENTNDETNMEMNHTMGDSAVQDNTEVGVGENAIVRQGIINVNAIDKDNDGNVYQCPMDWNVIDDKPGTCPQCGMDLVKVSVKEAKKNLLDNGYKVE